MTQARPKPSRVTLKDVADEAGVSVATVSRVVSGNATVANDLAKRVRVAANRLGYRPNLVAKSLRVQQTGTVGVVVPMISNPFFPLLVEQLEHQLDSGRVQLFLCDSRGDEAQQRNRIDALMARQVDAIVLIPSPGDTDIDYLDQLSDSVPLVVMDRKVEGSNVAFVSVDNAAGIRMAVQHLADCGSDTFNFVGADTSIWSSRVRLEAFETTLRSMGLPSHRVMVEDFTVSDGVLAGERLVARGIGRGNESIVCANDLLAIGVARALQTAGVRIPEEVMLVGFDDIEFARLMRPALTTVRQPVSELAAAVVELLHRSERDPSAIRSVERFLAPELVVRDSTVPNP